MFEIEAQNMQIGLWGLLVTTPGSDLHLNLLLLDFGISRPKSKSLGKAGHSSLLNQCVHFPFQTGVFKLVFISAALLRTVSEGRVLRSI